MDADLVGTNVEGVGMMGDSDFFAGVLVGFVVGAALIGSTFNISYRADMIDRGLAGYCADNGRFAFNGECGE